MNLSYKQNHKQQGFTLVEVLVSTALFVTVFSAMLGLFDYTLKINRRVQALREAAQGTRTFSEIITREVRNGRIDYQTQGIWASECQPSNYNNANNNSLALITKTGDKLCFYFSGADMYLKKSSPAGETNSLLFNSANFSIDPTTFRFTVRPVTNPNPSSAPRPQIQPSVTIAGIFTVNKNGQNPTTINYQTTISTDVYDILK